MTLHEFLRVCNPKDYVGIWDIDGDPCRKNKSKKRFEERPAEQNYFKIENIPYGRIEYKLEKEVAGINHTAKGCLVRIYTKGRAKESIDRYDLANKIAEAIRRSHD